MRGVRAAGRVPCQLRRVGHVLQRLWTPTPENRCRGPSPQTEGGTRCPRPRAWSSHTGLRLGEPSGEAFTLTQRGWTRQWAAGAEGRRSWWDCARLLAARGTRGDNGRDQISLVFPDPFVSCAPPPAAWPCPPPPHPLPGPHMASSHPPGLPHTPAPGPPGWLLKLNLLGSRAPEQGCQWLDESGTEEVGIATGSR